MPDVIKPFKIKSLTLAKIIKNEKNLGCAGFNGDKDFGKNGQILTISRNVKIIPELSNKNRIDANCISTDGGSGELFFEEKYNDELQKNEYYFISVIWGVINDGLDEKGDFVKAENVITSITPVSVFYDELTDILTTK